MVGEPVARCVRGGVAYYAVKKRDDPGQFRGGYFKDIFFDEYYIFPYFGRYREEDRKSVV